MNSATIGLALGALNIATTKASLFEEDFSIDNYDQTDFDTNFGEIAEFDDDFQEDFSEADGRMLQNMEDDDDGEDDDQPRRKRGRGRGRRGGRRGRWGKGKGRKGKKNKKPFNYEEMM